MRVEGMWRVCIGECSGVCIGGCSRVCIGGCSGVCIVCIIAMQASCIHTSLREGISISWCFFIRSNKSEVPHLGCPSIYAYGRQYICGIYKVDSTT